MKWSPHPLLGFFPLLFVACALLKGAASPDTQATMIRAAFVDIYAADLERALDSSPVCTEGVAAVRVAESRWASAWSRAGMPSDPPMTLVCPPVRDAGGDARDE